jgi:hypothetical protein
MSDFSQFAQRGEPQENLALTVVPAKALMELFITKDLR